MQSALPSAETPAASRQVRPPIIQECVVHYDCRILHNRPGGADPGRCASHALTVDGKNSKTEEGCFRFAEAADWRGVSANAVPPFEGETGRIYGTVS